MKLSNIVRYLNHLDTLSVHDAASTAMAEVNKITKIVAESKVQIDDVSATLAALESDLDISLHRYDETLKDLRKNVQALIEQHESEYFAARTPVHCE